MCSSECQLRVAFAIRTSRDDSARAPQLPRSSRDTVTLEKHGGEATASVSMIVLPGSAPLKKSAAGVPTGGRSIRVTTVYQTSMQMEQEDRKSTRLNSSHLVISYAVFCLKKKKKNITRVYCSTLLTYT